MTLNPALVLEMMAEAGAVMRGHFSLTSGEHSSGYVQGSQLFGRPEFTEPIVADLSDRFRAEGITCVVGPALGGVILAYSVARCLGARAVYAERIQGIMSLSRGFQIGGADRVLVVEDVIATGGSVREVLNLVRDAGASVVGVAVVADRSDGTVDFGLRTERMAIIRFDLFPADDCPLCQANVALRRPKHGRL
jgi:orotate phosphoribosyltransferase